MLTIGRVPGSIQTTESASAKQENGYYQADPQATEPASTHEPTPATTTTPTSPYMPASEQTPNNGNGHIPVPGAEQQIYQEQQTTTTPTVPAYATNLPPPEDSGAQARQTAPPPPEAVLPPAAPRPSRWPWILGGLVVLGTIGGGAYWLLRSRKGRQ